MVKWSVGIVVQCDETDRGVQEVAVRICGLNDVEKAVHYTDVTRALVVGDVVSLNSTSVKLGLGSGGYHIVYAILNECDEHTYSQENMQSDESTKPSGHIMKLRYTPLQRAVLAVEEEQSPYHQLFLEPRSLQGLPVLIGELHSMLPIAVCWLRKADLLKKPLNIVYIMTDGGTLPIAWSRHVQLLQQLGWLQATITYGHAYGGDLEAVNKFTALIAAKHVLQADVVIVTMGPGTVGTGTVLGHTAMEVGEIVNAVTALNGIPVIMPRISFADSRPRHHGISHHLMSTLQVAARSQPILPIADSLSDNQQQLIVQQLQTLHQDSTDPLPINLCWVSDVTLQSVVQCLAGYPETVTTMGRSFVEDESFFLSVCAAAEYVSNLLRNGNAD